MFLLAIPVTARATVWYVDDSVAASGDGLSWNTAFQTLQEALAVAASGDEIRVGMGTYVPGNASADTFALVSAVALRGGFAGVTSGTPDANDPDVFVTTLDGQDVNAHVVTAVNTAPGTVLSGFVVTGGHYSTTSFTNVTGGAGLFCDNATIAVDKCVFSENRSANGLPGASSVAGQASGAGSGMYCRNSVVTVSDSAFTSNMTGNGGNGGAGNSGDAGVPGYGAGLYATESTVAVTDSTFTSNRVGRAGVAGGSLAQQAPGHGGAAAFENCPSVFVAECEFVDNEAGEGSSGSLSTSRGGNGGGLFASNSELTVENCRFDSNRSGPNMTSNGFAGIGGGVCVTGSMMSAIFTGCEFTENQAPFQRGAGGAAAVLGGVATWVECEFSNNTAGNGFGVTAGDAGAMLVRDSMVELDGCRFQSNVTGGSRSSPPPTNNGGSGGAVAASNSASLLITSCEFIDNRTSDVHDSTTALSGHGGALYLNGGSATIDRTLFYMNRTGNGGNTSPGGSGNGGAIHVAAGTLTLDACKFLLNETGQTGGPQGVRGGGGAVSLAGSAGATITNCLMVANSAGNGGAIRETSGAAITVRNSTISDNTAAAGGGVHTSTGGITIVNDIIWDNQDSTGTGLAAQVTVQSAFASITFSCLNGVALFNGNTNSDPLFVDPGSGDFHLSANSPAIDTGSNAAIAGVMADLDGNPRISNGIVDMGAYEADQCPLDLDGDGVVGLGDLGIVLSNFGCNGGGCPGDLDGDGDTDLGDLGAMLAAFGMSCD